MKNLLVIRHAKSSWDEPSLADLERPLNQRGKRDAPFMGKLLRSRGLAPDLIVSSPARRALKTAKLFAGAFGYPKERIVVDEGAYLQGVPALLGIIRALSDQADHVCLVGHNPDSTDLVNELTGAGIASMPTCGVASVRFPVDSWAHIMTGSGTLEFLDYPKRHSAASGIDDPETRKR